jgi:hypothetical protein
MTYDELKVVTRDRSSYGRTPGTNRTIFLTHLVCFIAAIPALAKNPAVLAKVLELATLDVVGVTPQEVFRETGSILPPL